MFQFQPRSRPEKRLLLQIGARKKKRGRDVRMLSRLIFFFAPFSTYQISHNYVIPQAMPHAIPETHCAFCPHRFKGSLKSPNVTANVWVMEVEMGGIQTLSPYRWQFSFLRFECSSLIPPRLPPRRDLKRK